MAKNFPFILGNPLRKRVFFGGSRGGGQGGRGRMGGFGLGPGGECICPRCGTRIPHQRGIPCYQQLCPKCGTSMSRVR